MADSTLLFEENPNPMLVFDMVTQKIEEVNQSAIKKYGYSEEEFRELTIKDICPPEDISKLKEAFSGLTQNRDPQVVGIHRHLTRRGEVFQAKITTQPLPDKKGKKRIAHILDVTELMNAKHGYREACTELEKHIDANPLALIKFDSNFKIIQWSRRAEELSGFNKEQMLGKTPLETGFIIEEEQARVAGRMEELASGINRERPFETKVETQSGQRLDVRLHTSILHDQDGSLKSIVTFLENISEEKEYQRKLEEEQKRVERAQNLAKIGWWSYEVEEDRVIWSDILYDILNIDKEKFEATFQAFNSMVHPDDRAKLEGVMQQAWQSEKAIDYNLRITTGDNEIIYTQCRAQSQLNSRGQLVHLSGVLQDITERVLAKEELERNKKLFENLFLQSPVAMAMVDKHKKVQKVNQSFVDLFGYSKDEILGEDLLTHLLPEDRYDKIPKLYSNAFSGQDRYYEDERVTKDGERINLFVGALPVELYGEVIAVFGIYVNVTQLKTIENQLKESLNEKEILLAEIHHRVKNNLAIISGLLELEGMNWEEDDVRAAFRESQLRIKSIALIHEKLYQTEDFANLQFEDYVLQLVDAVIDTLNVDSKQLETHIEADDINLNINQAIPCALIVNELVTNAIEHGFNGQQQGTVSVTMKEKSNEVQIRVKDDGRGIPEQGSDIFTRSLGLTLVKQLAKQLDATLQTYNDNGACFEITFEKQSKAGSGSNYFV